MWTIYANNGYARHLFYLSPGQTADALKINIISRCCCIISIAIGKISVAFLIERIICPPGAPRPISTGPNIKRTRLRSIDWRRATLRGISGSVALSAVVTVILFYVQCQPASAYWDRRLLPPNGTAKCWNPIPVNTWDLVIASYWTLLDFVLALFPIPLILTLHLPLARKLLLCLLLSMGIFAGIAAAIKTSKVPISVKGKRDITWQTVELLLWNGIEMNVIIIAACIPTLRPVFLVLLRRPEAREFDDGQFSDGRIDGRSGNMAGLGQHGSDGRGGSKGQSYYLAKRRRSSVLLGSHDSSNNTQQQTYHSAKTSPSPTKQTGGNPLERASISDGSTALGHQTPSPPNEKDLEAAADVQISTREIPHSRDGPRVGVSTPPATVVATAAVVPRPLEIYKTVSLETTSSARRSETFRPSPTSAHHDTDSSDDCWDLSCSSHHHPRPRPQLHLARSSPPSSPTGNSWRKPRPLPLTYNPFPDHQVRVPTPKRYDPNVLIQDSEPDSGQDPDAITAVGGSPPPFPLAHHNHHQQHSVILPPVIHQRFHPSSSTPSSAPASSTPASASASAPIPKPLPSPSPSPSPSSSSSTSPTPTRKRSPSNLSAPLSHIGRPSPPLSLGKV